MTRAVLTIGLGYGDECKGATVDYLVRKHKSKLVIRYSGGSQAAHNVVLPNGKHHCFSQFGAGTFAGAETFLDRAMIVDPLALLHEAESLCVQHAIPAPITSLLTVHPACLITTPLHRAMNRARSTVETHGSCTAGIGETRSYWLKYGNDSLTAADVYMPVLLEVMRDKLELLRQRMLAEAEENGLDQQPFRSFSPIEYIRQVCSIRPRVSQYVSPIQQPATIIFEGAQGILLDEYYGFHPFTTWSDVTPRNAVELCKGMNWEYETIGCLRAYMTRHGPGPFPTEFTADERRIYALDDPHNRETSYRGPIRFGHLDIAAIRYSAKVCELARAPLSGLAVSCLDHVQKGMLACDAPKFEMDPLNTRLGGEQQHRFRWHMKYKSGREWALLRDVAPIQITANGPTWEHRQDA